MLSVPALLVVRGDGSHAELAPGHVVYLWAGDDRTNQGARPGSIRAALEDARDELLAIRPDGVCVHGSPSQLLARGEDGATALEWVAAELRGLLPGVRLWVGVGCDGWVDDWRAGRATEAQVLQPLQRCAALASGTGAEAIVWNAETAWKHAASDKRTRAELDALARRFVASVTKIAARAVHVVSSFDHVGFHMALPFDALLSGNVAAFTAQNYVARAGDAPPRGLLKGRIGSAAKSIESARQQQKFPADERGPDGVDASHEDVDVFSTVQLHGTDALDLARELAEAPLVLSWSVPMVREGGRADARGLEAARVARVIRAAGAGPGAVRRYQEASSGALRVDGVLGPRTMASLGALSADGVRMRILAQRLRFMAGLPNWPAFSRGWARRICDLLEE